MADRATAIACRWPPDIMATVTSSRGTLAPRRCNRLRVSSSIRRCDRNCSGRGSQAGPAISRPAKKFSAGPQIVEQRQVLIDRLDPGLTRIDG